MQSGSGLCSLRKAVGTVCNESISSVIAQEQGQNKEIIRAEMEYGHNGGVVSDFEPFSIGGGTIAVGVGDGLCERETLTNNWLGYGERVNEQGFALALSSTHVISRTSTVG